MIAQVISGYRALDHIPVFLVLTFCIIADGVHPINAAAAAAAGRSTSNDGGLSARSNTARTCHTLLTYATDRTPTI
ncbi:hypothetical protein DBV15_07238 [Temnothorax longispinosus]|uniref:Uncharacterized protein n=1 Tax=Temnothorax longispinosus TaxID=300112 RepID=A0A4S2JNH6_9HYME|nr:hypothetical protein DBV15_07238 [Temnothorax longispinosus]